MEKSKKKIKWSGRRGKLCAILQHSKNLSGIVFAYFLSLFSTDVILETKAPGVRHISLICQSITLPHGDSSWEIILKCRELGRDEDHTNQVFMEGLQAGRSAAEGAGIAGQAGRPWREGWWLIVPLPGNPELQRATTRKTVFLCAPGWNRSWEESGSTADPHAVICSHANFILVAWIFIRWRRWS